MPYIYTDEDKAEALRILAETFGDITAAAIHTGIPARTLRRWRQQARHGNGGTSRVDQNGKLPEKSPAGNNAKTVNPNRDIATEAAAQFERLREQLMTHIFGLSANLSDDPDTAHLRAVAVARLLDRVVKLDTLIPSYQPQQTIIMKFEYPDGTLHDNPPWVLDDTDQDDPFQSAETDHPNAEYKPYPSPNEQDHTEPEHKSSVSFW